MAKKVIYLTENDLKQIVNQSVYAIISESTQNEGWTWNDPFGASTRRENRLNTLRFGRLYGEYVEKIQAIADEITRRINSLEGKSNQEQINEIRKKIEEGVKSQLNEGIGAIVGKIGAKLAGSAFAKTAAKVGGKALTVGALASVPAFIIGPEKIHAFFEKFKDNRGQLTTQEVIAGYDELATWMGNICSALQAHPEIFGEAAVSDEVLNGPEAPEEVKEKGGATGSAIELAAGLGVCAIPYVGWVLGIVDLAHALIHTGAKNNQEALRVVAQQIKYLDKSINEINALLEKTKNPQMLQQAAAQQGQMQQSQQGRQMPQNYKMGQPAPFASNDPQQVARFQSYVGIQVTGQWDKNTQIAWNNWLKNTYGQSQPAMQQATALSENEFKSFVKKIIAESLQ